MEVMNDTETVVMKVRMIGLGNNGSYLIRINPPLSPYKSAYLSVLLVPLILASTFFVFFHAAHRRFFLFLFFFSKRDLKVRGGGAGKGKGRGEKGEKKLTLAFPLPYFDASTSRSIESPNLSHSREEGAYSALEIDLIVNFNQ